MNAFCTDQDRPRLVCGDHGVSHDPPQREDGASQKNEKAKKKGDGCDRMPMYYITHRSGLYCITVQYAEPDVAFHVFEDRHINVLIREAVSGEIDKFIVCDRLLHHIR